GQGEEELLHLLHVQGGILARRLCVEALLQAARDDLETRAVERPGDRGELGHDVRALSARLEHGDDAANLTLGAAQSPHDVGNGCFVHPHSSLQTARPCPWRQPCSTVHRGVSRTGRRRRGLARVAGGVAWVPNTPTDASAI